MNVIKRIEALEEAVKRQEPDESWFIFIRLTAPETKDEPMRFATHEGASWERDADESEDDFDERIKADILATDSSATAYRVMFSVDRRDCHF